MTTLDPTTIGTDQLARMLSAWAAGHLPDSAALALLTSHETWLRRRDFLAACVDAVDDAWTGGGDPAPMAAIVWARVPAFAATARASSGELAILGLAASLAGVEAGSLRELTGGLGPNTLAGVLDAIAHRAGWHETGRTHTVTGHPGTQPTGPDSDETDDGDPWWIRPDGCPPPTPARRATPAPVAGLGDRGDGRGRSGPGLPTFEDIRARAYAVLGDAADWLRSDWRPGTGPTTEAARAVADARAAISTAKAALNRASAEMDRQ
jgi:hypothetical protein